MNELELTRVKNAMVNLAHQRDQVLQSIAGWQKAEPLILGSWAREELCPKSDLDILFLGDEVAVREVVGKLQEAGLKVRARVPENLQDWCQGVQSKDILALFAARALSASGEEKLKKEQQKILASRQTCRRIFNDLVRDRNLRNQRFDSMFNFLEPNLKHGPGGLRDIQFALQIVPVIDHQGLLTASHPALKALREAKEFLLGVRFLLHTHGFQDQLIGSEQIEIAKELGFSDQKELMRKISRCLARGHFYSEWVLENFKTSEKKRQKLQAIKLEKPADLMKLLESDSTILAQQLVREKIDPIYREQKTDDRKARGLLLRTAILYRTPDAVTKAVFHSRWIDKLCPRIRPLVGYVQHDQYHRFTAESHLLQTIREVKRVWLKPRVLGRLQKFAKKLTAKDWEILSWTALYHDLAKGQEGDHSELGEKWVQTDLTDFELSADCRLETQFLVKNHLELSQAAFRKNPQDMKTWLDLYEKGFDQRRIQLMAIFTAIDIRATNPEAWTSWKANLLYDCVVALAAPEKEDYYHLSASLGRLNKAGAEGIDPSVLTYFSLRSLKKELAELQNKTESKTVEIKILRDKKKRLWLRFFTPQDRIGLFASFVKVMFQAGISVQEALIQTLPGTGVYDLFQVTGRELGKKTPLLQRHLAKALTEPNWGGLETLPEIKLSSITLISSNAKEMVLSFKGFDQRGLLWSLADRLAKENISIRSARVHTWGKQVDDLIHIEPTDRVEDLIQRLKAEWVQS